MFIYAMLILLPALASANFPHDAIDQLEINLFNELDTDNDFTISKSECEGYFLNYDVNKDGELTLAELSAVIDKASPELVGKEAGLFALYDRDGNGLIDVADIDEFIDGDDSNGDGVIGPDEFHVFIINGLGP